MASSNSPITTHILDLAKGRPVQNMKVALYKMDGKEWLKVNEGTTNDNGRCATLMQGKVLEKETYKMKFETDDYYKEKGLEAFYPFIEIVFQSGDLEHYHIPLLISPYGFSTYRGS